MLFSEGINFFRNPFIIQRLRDSGGVPHPLCPVVALRDFLNLTRSFKLFVSHDNLEPCSINKICPFMCMLIRQTNQGSILKYHDLRKLATFGFFRFVLVDEACGFVGCHPSGFLGDIT